MNSDLFLACAHGSRGSWTMLVFSLIAYWLLCLISIVTNVYFALSANRNRLRFKATNLMVSTICGLLVLWSYFGPGDSTADSTSNDAKLFIVLVLPLFVFMHSLYLALDRWIHRRMERAQPLGTPLESALNRTCESKSVAVQAQFDVETANKKLAHLLPKNQKIPS